MCFPSGIFMFNIINDHTASTVLYMSLIEIILVVFIYGIRNFLENIREMEIWMPVVLKFFWIACWVFITPALVLAITVIGFTERELDHYSNQFLNYVYPDSVQVLAYLVELSPVLGVVMVMVYMIITKCVKGKGDSLFCAKKWLPRDDWKPKSNGLDNENFES